MSITNDQSSLRLTSIESVMPSSHLIFCRPLLLLPPIPLSIRVFSNESTLRMRWPKYWSFSFSIILSKEIPTLISFRKVILSLFKIWCIFYTYSMFQFELLKLKCLGFFSVSVVKNLPVMQDRHETLVRSLGWVDPLEKGMTTLSYSCLENLMDRGAWQAAVHRVTKSWT